MQHSSLANALRRCRPRSHAATSSMPVCLQRGRTDLRLAGPPNLPGEPEVIYRGERRNLTSEDWQRRGFLPSEAMELAGRTHPRLPGVSVVVLTTDGAGPLEHYPFHSPGGFEWGYEGSGPADLARCILLHHFKIAPSRRGLFFPPRPDELPVSYQAFKRQVISRLPVHHAWTLTRGEITEWIQGGS